MIKVSLTSIETLTCIQENVILKPKEWYTSKIWVKGNKISVSYKDSKTEFKKIIMDYVDDRIVSMAGTIAFGSNFSKIAFTHMKLSKFYTP